VRARVPSPSRLVRRCAEPGRGSWCGVARSEGVGKLGRQGTCVQVSGFGQASTWERSEVDTAADARVRVGQPRAQKDAEGELRRGGRKSRGGVVLGTDRRKELSVQKRSANVSGGVETARRQCEDSRKGV
jgi:hypothetical protein